MRQIRAKRRSIILGVAGVLLLTLLSLGLVLAAGEMMPRTLVSSGGGIVSQGDVALHSAIGQPAVGAVGSNLTLCSGYLCGAGAPPVTGGSNTLYIPILFKE